jgi:MFS family permease
VGLDSQTRSKAVLLGSLYLSQGLPFGFLTQAVPILLRNEGMSLTRIGDASLLLAPWLFKFLWAPFVDRTWSSRLGRRRTWILPIQLLTASTLLAVAFVNPSGTDIVTVLLVATFVTALLASTQDIATDGLAVSVLRPEERGWGNGIQVAGYRLGMVVGGGALLVLFARVGWFASFACMAGLMLLATVPVGLHEEAPVPDDAGGEELWSVLTRPGMRAWLGLLVVYKLGEQIGGAVTKPMLADLELDLEVIGWLGAADSVASLLGAMVGGLATGWLGRKRALVGFGVVQATGVLAWALPALGVVGLLGLAGVKVYDGFVGSLATAALFTAMMDAARPSSGGTDYTVQASAVLVAGFGGSVLGGRLADALVAGLGSLPMGYAAHYAVAALLTLAGAAFVAIRPLLRGESGSESESPRVP